MSDRLHPRHLPLLIVRIVFVLVAAGLAVRVIQSDVLLPPSVPVWQRWAVFIGLLALALVTVGFDALVRRKQLDLISAVYFGLLIGLFLTYVLRLALIPIIES